MDVESIPPLPTGHRVIRQPLEHGIVKRTRQFPLDSIRVRVDDYRDMRFVQSEGVEEVQELFVGDDDVHFGVGEDIGDVFWLQAIVDGFKLPVSQAWLKSYANGAGFLTDNNPPSGRDSEDGLQECRRVRTQDPDSL